MSGQGRELPGNSSLPLGVVSRRKQIFTQPSELPLFTSKIIVPPRPCCRRVLRPRASRLRAAQHPRPNRLHRRIGRDTLTSAMREKTSSGRERMHRNGSSPTSWQGFRRLKPETTRSSWQSRTGLAVALSPVSSVRHHHHRHRLRDHRVDLSQLRLPVLIQQLQQLNVATAIHRKAASGRCI